MPRTFTRAARDAKSDHGKGVDGLSARIHRMKIPISRLAFRFEKLRRALEALQEGEEGRQSRKDELLRSSQSNLLGVGPRQATWLYGSLFASILGGEYALMRTLSRASLGESGFWATVVPTLYAAIGLGLVGHWVLNRYAVLSSESFQGRANWLGMGIAVTGFAIVIGGLSYARSDLYMTESIGVESIQATTPAPLPHPELVLAAAGPSSWKSPTSPSVGSTSEGGQPSGKGAVIFFGAAAVMASLFSAHIGSRLLEVMGRKAEYKHLLRQDKAQEKLEAKFLKLGAEKATLESDVLGYQDLYNQTIDALARQPKRPWWKG